MIRRKMLPLVAASVLLMLVLTSSAAAELSVKQWWEKEFGAGTYDAAGGNWTMVNDGYWQNHIEGQFLLRLEEAGDRNWNSFGWVEVDSDGALVGSTLNEIFKGSASVGASKFVDIQVDHFAFYMKTATKTYYTVQGLNPTNTTYPDGYMAAWIFDDPQPAHQYYNHVIAWEDRDGVNFSTDHDHNDMIVRMCATPEPATFVLLALSALPIALLRRRKAA